MKTPTSDQEFSEAWNIRAQNQADAAIRRGNALAAAVEEFLTTRPLPDTAGELAEAVKAYRAGTFGAGQ